MSPASNCRRPLPLSPLSAGLAIALASGLAGAVQAAPIGGVPLPHSHQLLRLPYELRHALPTNLPRLFPATPPTTRQPPAGYVPVRSVVGDCSDGAGASTLRHLIAAANSGDTIDLSTSGCSTITLTQGQIVVDVADLTVIGPSTRTTIDANNLSRAFYHEGTGTLTLENLAIVNGRCTAASACTSGESPAQIGGAILSEGNLTLSNSSVSNSYVSGLYTGGGGIGVAGALSLTASTVSGNTAKGVYTAPPPPPGVFTVGGSPQQPAANTNIVAIGGGMYVGHTLTIVNSTISGNQVLADNRLGGGNYGTGIAFGAGVVSAVKYMSGDAGLSNTISGSTIDSNTASTVVTNSSTGSEVGGIFSANPLILIDSTVSNNAAKYFGGIASESVFTASNSTIAGNSAQVVGGVYIGYNSTLTLHSTIIASNTATDTTTRAADLSAGTGSGTASNLASAGSSRPADSASPNAVTVVASNNLITSHDASIVLPADTITADPQLQPLANNGGPTRTQALGAGSPAIDHGDNLLALPYDQRGAGYARVVGAAADIGAYEAQSVAAIPTLSAWMAGVLVGLLAVFGWRHRLPASSSRRE